MLTLSQRLHNESEVEESEGTLIVDSDSIRFINNKNPRDAYFSIPSNAISDVFYSRVSGRRIKTAIFLTGPLGLFLNPTSAVRHDFHLIWPIWSTNRVCFLCLDLLGGRVVPTYPLD